MAWATKNYNFATANPNLLKEWHPTKNGKLKPQDIAPYSPKMVWWLCESGHEWQTRAYTRTRGAGCPFCAGKRIDELPLHEWLSKNSKIGFGKVFRKVQDVPSGNILVEMPREAWQNLLVLTLAPEDLGKLIREYRRRQGLTQVQFAKMVGHHRNSIGYIEQGKEDRITFNIYRDIISVILK